MYTDCGLATTTTIGPVVQGYPTSSPVYSEECFASTTDSCPKTITSSGGGSRSKGPTLNSLDDKMTELVSIQGSNGAFKIHPKNWKNSVFEEYAGSYEAVQSSCPTSVNIKLWTTALAIKILELKMLGKKDLWELVAQKSRKYILAKLNQNIKERFSLLAKAEEYIMRC